MTEIYETPGIVEPSSEKKLTEPLALLCPGVLYSNYCRDHYADMTSPNERISKRLTRSCLLDIVVEDLLTLLER